MIPKGLKVGDTYLEGELVYKVVRVLDDGRYEGQWTGATPSKPSVENLHKSVEKVEKKPEKITKADVDYDSIPYAQLKKLCAEKGLDATGKKDELIARLEG